MREAWKDWFRRHVPDVILDIRRQILYGKSVKQWLDRRRLRKISSVQSQRLSLAQAGQDYWVYGEVFNERRGGYFVDVGAYDGVNLSNTYLLEQRYGWNGICIEANDLIFDSLRNNRNALCVNSCIDSTDQIVSFVQSSVMGGIVAPDCDNKSAAGLPVAQIKAETLATVLNRQAAPKLIEYLSIDIEGAEDRALLDFPFGEYTFICMTVERPSAALRRVLSENDYLLIKEIPGLDCFFIHRSYLRKYWDNMIGFHEKKFLLKQWDGKVAHF